jgi:hypothetical protein
VFNAVNIWLAFHEPVGGFGHDEKFEEAGRCGCITEIVGAAFSEDCLESQSILAVHADQASVVASVLALILGNALIKCLYLFVVLID